MKKLELYKEFLKSKRPINSIILKRIEEHLKADYIYNSNAIEGNTLTLRETNLIIEHGVIIEGKSLKEHLEVKGQEYALNFLSEVMKEQEKISLRMIREINSLVMVSGGGTFKTLPNEIVGAKFNTSPPYLVEEHLNKLIEDFYNSDKDIIKRVAIFHADFEKIHPFPDGNGRTGRLLMNLELMKAGYPITIIRKEERDNYYNALEKTHSSNDYEDIISFIEKNVEKSFEFYFEHITNNWKEEIEDFYRCNNGEKIKKTNFFKDKYSMTLEENIFVVKRNLVDYIWKSANLEGIAVTFPQTQTIIDGIAVQGMRINEINAIVNLKHAWYFTLDNIDYPIDFKFISQINKIIGDYNLIPHSGEIRNTDVSMGGTTWKPKLPNREEIEEQINIINGIENITDRAMTMMLYLMRTQPFYDGNKRTAMIVTNQIMVQNGKGIISIPLEEQTTFREMLIDFYETNNMEKIKKFIYNNCIDGINFEKETPDEEKQ